MVSLLATLLKLSYTSKINMPQGARHMVAGGLFFAVVVVITLVLLNLCNALIAILDLSAALTILILLAKQNDFK